MQQARAIYTILTASVNPVASSSNNNNNEDNNNNDQNMFIIHGSVTCALNGLI